MFHAGIATHLVPSAKIPALEADLAAVASDADVQHVLAAFHDHHAPPPSYAAHQGAMDQAFAADSVEGTLERLGGCPLFPGYLVHGRPDTSAPPQQPSRATTGR